MSAASTPNHNSVFILSIKPVYIIKLAAEIKQNLLIESDDNGQQKPSSVCAI